MFFFFEENKLTYFILKSVLPSYGMCMECSTVVYILIFLRMKVFININKEFLKKI
jgi:hypothetical protein